jgi:hypothetical protein
MSSPIFEIEINGQKFPTRFDVMACMELENITGANTLQNFHTDMRMLVAMWLVGLKHGQKFQSGGTIEFKKNLEDVAGMIPMAQLGKIVDSWKHFTANTDNKISDKEAEPGESVGAASEKLP